VPLDELEDRAININNLCDVPHPVATHRLNVFGLYDQSANTPDTAWSVPGFRVIAEPRRLSAKNYYHPVSPFLVPSR
jgi:hypothetical protein